MDVLHVVGEILDSAVPVSSTHLAQLSDLDSSEAEQVIDALNSVSFERRRLLVQHMMELAEENVDLNFDPLFRRCMENEDDEVRETAINGLWECEERSLIEPLLQRLKNDEEEHVRAAAAQSLGRFAMLAELGKLLERDAQKVERGLLEIVEGEQETSPEVRRRAIEALAPINAPRVREIILETYESASDKVRASALYAMGQNGDPSWIPYILDEMESAEPELRYEAAGAAGRLGDESLVPALARMGSDENPEVQAAVVTALSAIGGPTARRVLRRLIQHADDHVRELALDALEGMQTLEAPAVDLLRRTGRPHQTADEDDDEDDVFEALDDDLGLDEDEDYDE